jgi:hypothetical protein
MTSTKMTNYLNRLDEMGLVHVRVIVPDCHRAAIGRACR